MKRVKGFYLFIMLVVSLCFALTIMAQEKKETEGVYTIQKGDTLWDISAKFLKDPFLWPKLWQRNPYITNPHWIYPGNPVRLSTINLSRAEVHGVVTFYHFFREAPPGARVLRLCRAEACQAMNGRALEEHAKRRLGIQCGETTPDGRITLEAVYCLGLCASAPSAMLDGEVHGRVTPERLDQLLAD